ncbi:MAG: hypothetical protein WDN30_05975 [Pararobbsia sp.]
MRIDVRQEAFSHAGASRLVPVIWGSPGVDRAMKNLDCTGRRGPFLCNGRSKAQRTLGEGATRGPESRYSWRVGAGGFRSTKASHSAIVLPRAVGSTAGCDCGTGGVGSAAGLAAGTVSERGSAAPIPVNVDMANSFYETECRA